MKETKRCICTMTPWHVVGMGAGVVVMVLGTGVVGYFWGCQAMGQEYAMDVVRQQLAHQVSSAVYGTRKHERLVQEDEGRYDGEEKRGIESYAVLKEYGKEQDAWRWAEKMMENYTVPLYVQIRGSGKKRRFLVVTGWMERTELEQVIDRITREEKIANVRIMARDN